jgi:uncharacterized protein DUF6705
MKKQIILTALILFSISSRSQIIRDMAADPIDGDSKNGNYYVKDVNNYFGPFIGAWSHVDGNKEFRIYISKVTKENVVFPEYHIDYYIDGLEIRYEKYENGELIFASPALGFASGISKEAGVADMSFIDYEREETMVRLQLKMVLSGMMSHNGHYNKISFKLNEHERRNTYYDSHPNASFFSVPDDMEMVWFQQ